MSTVSELKTFVDWIQVSKRDFVQKFIPGNANKVFLESLINAENDFNNKWIDASYQLFIDSRKSY
jgi:hypothetical protein